MWKETKHFGLYREGRELHFRLCVHYTYFDLHIRVRKFSLSFNVTDVCRCRVYLHYCYNPNFLIINKSEYDLGVFDAR